MAAGHEWNGLQPMQVTLSSASPGPKEGYQWLSVFTAATRAISLIYVLSGQKTTFVSNDRGTDG